MAEITSSDNVIKKLQEFDKYITQSLDVLRELKKIREDAEKINHTLSQKKEELTRRENELLAFQKKIDSISKDANSILSPILKEKEELEKLNAKLTEGLANSDATIKTKIEEGLDKISENQKTLIADFLYKQNALVSNLSQQIDSYERLTEALKSQLESQGNQIKNLETQNSGLRQTLEKQRQEFSAKYSDLSDVKIPQMEREIAQTKAELNEITSKLSNIRFKRLLRL